MFPIFVLPAFGTQSYYDTVCTLVTDRTVYNMYSVFRMYSMYNTIWTDRKECTIRTVCTVSAVCRIGTVHIGFMILGDLYD